MHAIFDVPLQHFILRARFSHCDTQTKALDVYPIVYVVRDENPLSDLNTEYSDRMSPESFSGSGRSPEGGCLLLRGNERQARRNDRRRRPDAACTQMRPYSRLHRHPPDTGYRRNATGRWANAP